MNSLVIKDSGLNSNSSAIVRDFTKKSNSNSKDSEERISTDSQVGETLYQARPDFDDFLFDDFDGEVTDNDARLMTEYLRQGKTDIISSYCILIYKKGIP